MSSVWVILRDDGDTEVLAVYTVDAMASATVDDLNEAAARCGTTERFRAIRVDLNSGDKLPGQWVETTREVSPGLHLPVYAVDPDLTIIDEVKLRHASVAVPGAQQVWVSSEMMSSPRGRIKGVPPTRGDKFTVDGWVIEQNATRLKLWRRLIAVAVQQARWQPVPPGPVRVDLTFVLPRPLSHLDTRGRLKPNAPMICTVKPDGDKLARAVLDALTQCGAIGDDATVADLHITKPYTNNGGVGVLITVEPLMQHTAASAGYAGHPVPRP